PPLAPRGVDSVAAVLGLARLHQGNGFYLVAWEADQPLGHPHLALTDPPELQEVLVREPHPPRGIAGALTAAAQQEAAARGCGRMRVTMSVDNGPAQALYAACGYVDVRSEERRGGEEGRSRWA